MPVLTRDLALKLRWAVWGLLLLPCGFIALSVVNNDLGPDPGKELVLWSGAWAIRCLWLCLLVRPLKEITQINALLIYRRTFGLFAYFYALLHFLAYSIFLLGLDLGFLGEEITKRPFIIVGFLSLVLMTPLAFTSTQNWQRKLKKKWVKIHRLIYPVSLLVLVHFIWMQRSDYTEVVIYGIILAILLGYRVVKIR